jgi:golgi phosphoprotein 3
MISSPISGELARLRIASLHEAARHERLVRQAGHQAHVPAPRTHGRPRVTATLPEELLLLAVDHECKTSGGAARAALPYGLAGAVVAELLLREAAAVTDRGLLAVTGRLTGDGLLDDVLTRIHTSRRPRRVTGWVGALAGRLYNLRSRLSRRLATAGVLREEERRVLGVLPVRRYTVAEQSALAELRARLRAGLLGGDALNARTASLVGLVGACGLVDGLVACDERRAARSRAAAISDDDPVGTAVSAAIQEARADAVAGATAAVVASTIPTTS